MGTNLGPEKMGKTYHLNVNKTMKSHREMFAFHLPRSHWSPVVVVLLEGIPMGINPQCGPSTED